MCLPIGIRATLSVAAAEKWRIVRIDARYAFLQFGPAQRDVYLASP